MIKSDKLFTGTVRGEQFVGLDHDPREDAAG